MVRWLRLLHGLSKLQPWLVWMWHPPVAEDLQRMDFDLALTLMLTL